MSIPRIMVFRPSWEEFQNFSGYINYMESKGAHKAGLVKVCFDCFCGGEIVGGLIGMFSLRFRSFLRRSGFPASRGMT